MIKYLIFFLFLGCGGGETETIYVDTTGRSNPNPNPGALSFARDILPITQQHCASCHAGADFISSEAGFKRLGCRRVENRTMPPRNSPKYGQWTDQLWQTVVDFCR